MPMCLDDYLATFDSDKCAPIVSRHIGILAQVRRLGAELDTSSFSLKSKNQFRTRLGDLVQKVCDPFS